MLFGALLADGCTDYEDRVPVTGKIAVSAPAAYNFLMQHPPVDSPPMIHLRTLDRYPNTCYRLLTSAVWRKNGNELIVYVGDVVSEGGSCGAAFTQAESLIPLDTAFGRLELVVVLGDLSDLYDVTVTPERVELFGRATNFTIQTDSIWWKLPRRSVAMTCQYSNPSYSRICMNVVDSVFGQPGLSQMEVPSFGVWPYPPNAAVYVYRTESDFKNIKRLLETFPTIPLGQPGGVRIDLLNWRQEAYSRQIAGE